MISSLKKGKSGFFARDDFSAGWENRDAFTNDWYGKHLKAMGEKSLLDQREEVEAYRFLWLRTFHHPIYVRIETTNGDVRLSTKELGGAGGYEPGKVIRVQDMKLDRKAWCEFLTRLEKASYWRLPTDDDNDAGNDGSQWILEGVRDGRYHIVDRWSPIYSWPEQQDREVATKAAYSDACIYLLKLSGVDIDTLKGDLY